MQKPALQSVERSFPFKNGRLTVAVIILSPLVTTGYHCDCREYIYIAEIIEAIRFGIERLIYTMLA